MSTNKTWTEKEDRKIVFEIVNTELIKTTTYNTSVRKDLIDSIAQKLSNDPDFLARKSTKNPLDTISQHIRVWIAYLEGRKETKPPQKY